MFILTTTIKDFKSDDLTDLLTGFISIQDRKLYVKFPGYRGGWFHSYSMEYTDDEMVKDAVSWLKDKIIAGSYWPNIKPYRQM